MHSIRSRLSIPIQIFLVIFYIVFILALKQTYDNYQKHQRYEIYHNTMQEVSKSLEMVEKHFRRAALNHQQYEAAVLDKFKKVSMDSQTSKQVSQKPP